MDRFINYHFRIFKCYIFNELEVKSQKNHGVFMYLYFLTLNFRAIFLLRLGELERQKEIENELEDKYEQEKEEEKEMEIKLEEVLEKELKEENEHEKEEEKELIKQLEQEKKLTKENKFELHQRIVEKIKGW